MTQGQNEIMIKTSSYFDLIFARFYTNAKITTHLILLLSGSFRKIESKERCQMFERKTNNKL